MRSVDEAEGKAAAIQAEATVEVGVAERDRVLAEADGAMLAARIPGARKVVLGYGTAGPRLVGRNRAELRRPARLPCPGRQQVREWRGPTGREARAAK